MDLFYGLAESGSIERAGVGWLSGFSPVTMRVQPRPVAPGGLSKQTTVGPVWLVVRRDGACRVTLTPIADGVLQSAMAVAYDFDVPAQLTDAVVRQGLRKPVTWDGDTEPFSRHALRATFASVRAELVPVEVATIDPAGAENALTFTATDVFGDAITIEYRNPDAISQALRVEVLDLEIIVWLATDATGLITSTAADVKAAIEASEDASALVAVEIRDDDGGVADGSGLVSAQDPATVAAGTTYALGGFELAARAVGVGGRGVPVGTVDA